MNRIIGMVSFLILAALAPRAAADPELPGVAAAMQTVVNAHEVAGAVTAVTTPDQIVHLGATGLADLATQRPMEPNTVFWLASVTKSFTAVAVLMLQDEGKLNVSDPVAKYIPAYAALKGPSGNPANLTLQECLTHTTGYAQTKRGADLAATDLASLVESYVSIPLQTDPGTHWKYSNAGFDIAGRIIEIVSGESYDQFLQHRIFDPLGMTETTFYPSADQQQRLAVGYAKDRQTGALHPQPPHVFHTERGNAIPMPSGGLFSTAGDLAQYGQFLLNHGVYRGKRYLSEAAYQTLTTIHTGELPTGYSAAQIGHDLGWGLGVFVVRHPHPGISADLSVGSFGHPGAWGPDLIVDPVKHVAYVLMIQRSNLPDNFENAPGQALVHAAATALGKAD